MKLYTIDRNSKSKNPFVGGSKCGHSFPYFPPIFHPRNAWSLARSEHHSFEPYGQIVAFDSSKDASRRPLYWRYSGDSEQCYFWLHVLPPKQGGISVQWCRLMADCLHFSNSKIWHVLPDGTVWSNVFCLTCFSMFLANFDRTKIMYAYPIADSFNWLSSIETSC